MRKIAFCFLICDIIYQEEIWNIFFNNADQHKYNIYVHYKNDVPLKYFEKYKLTNCIETNYADISLVKAQNIMLEEGLKDEDNTHFIILSNSCIPLKSFDYIYNKLDDNYSYFTKIELFPRCFDMGFKRKYLQKSHQWCILNKKHAKEMLTPVYNIELFKNIYASDEHFYITNIYMKKLENEILISYHNGNNMTTFVDWTNPVKTGHPKEFINISDRDFVRILNNEHLFGRKFMPECNLMNKEYYINIISQKNQTLNDIYEINKSINLNKPIKEDKTEVVYREKPKIKEIPTIPIDENYIKIRKNNKSSGRKRR